MSKSEHGAATLIGIALTAIGVGATIMIAVNADRISDRDKEIARLQKLVETYKADREAPGSAAADLVKARQAVSDCQGKVTQCMATLGERDAQLKRVAEERARTVPVAAGAQTEVEEEPEEEYETEPDVFECPARVFEHGNPFPVELKRELRLGMRLSELQRAAPNGETKSSYFHVALDGDLFGSCTFYYSDQTEDPLTSWLMVWAGEDRPRAECLRMRAEAAFGPPSKRIAGSSKVEWANVAGYAVNVEDGALKIMPVDRRRL